ncbi:hypothetical protein Vafri_336 [Volvox africanus]|nr:hypothetical protein Vafri_336 [Volvox africanus]
MEREIIIQWKPDQEGHRYHVGITECPETRSVLSSGELQVQGKWTSKPFARAAVLHLASNGRGPHVTILGPMAHAESGSAPGAESGVKLTAKARKNQLMASKSVLISEHAAGVTGRYALRAVPKGAVAAAAVGKSKKRKAQEDAASPQDLEVLLAPMVVKDTKTGAAAEDGAPLFWGYCLPRGAADAATRALVEFRLAVVASLENDGPLVQSYKISELEEELRRAVVARKELAAATVQQKQHPQQQAAAVGEGDGAVRQGKKKRRRADMDATAMDAGDGGGTVPAVAQLHQALSDAKAHEARVSGYLELLKQFDGKTPVMYKGTTYKPKLERVPSPASPQPIKQHVVRIPAPESGLEALVLIESQREPMLIRVRQHWEELRRLLAGVPATDGEDGAPLDGAENVEKKAKAGTGAASMADAHGQGPAASEVPRFDFLPWINPGRQPDWLMELWHVLDPRGEVIAADDLRARANGIPGSTTRGTCRGEFDGQRQLPRLEPRRSNDEAGRAVKQEAAAAEEAGHKVHGGLGPPPVALTVVLDERRDVWEEELQSSVLQLLPWQAAGMPETASASGKSKKESEAADNELQRVRTALLHLHAEVFKLSPWKRVKRGGRSLGMEGAPEERLRGAAAPGSTAAEELIGPLPNVAALLREAAHPSLVRPAVRPLPPDATTAIIVAPVATGAAAGTSGGMEKACPLAAVGASKDVTTRNAAGTAPVHSTLAVRGDGPSVAEAPPASQKQPLLLLSAVQEPMPNSGGPAAVPLPQSTSGPPTACATVTPQQVMETSRRLLKSPYTMSVCAAKLLVEELIPPLCTLTSFMLPHLATSAMALVPGMTHTMANEMQAMVSAIFVQLGAMEDFMSACASANAMANGDDNGGGGNHSTDNKVKSLEQQFQDVQARNRQLASAAKVTVSRYGVHMVSAAVAHGSMEPPIPQPGKAAAAASVGTAAGKGTAAAAGGNASVGKPAGKAVAGNVAVPPPRGVAVPSAAARGAAAAAPAVQAAVANAAAPAAPRSAVIAGEAAGTIDKSAAAAAVSKGNATSSKDKSSSSNSSSSNSSSSNSSSSSDDSASGTGTSNATSNDTDSSASKSSSSGTTSSTSSGATSSTSSGTTSSTSSSSGKGTTSSSGTDSGSDSSRGDSAGAGPQKSHPAAVDDRLDAATGLYGVRTLSALEAAEFTAAAALTSSQPPEPQALQDRDITDSGQAASSSSTTSSSRTDGDGINSDGETGNGGKFVDTGNDNVIVSENVYALCGTGGGGNQGDGAGENHRSGGQDVLIGGAKPDDSVGTGAPILSAEAWSGGACANAGDKEAGTITWSPGHGAGTSPGSGTGTSSESGASTSSSSGSESDASSSSSSGEAGAEDKDDGPDAAVDKGASPGSGTGTSSESGASTSSSSSSESDASSSSSSGEAGAEDKDDGPDAAVDKGASPGSGTGTSSESGASTSSSSSSESDASSSSSSGEAGAEDKDDGPDAAVDKGASPGSGTGTSSESGASTSSSSSSESDASSSSSSGEAGAEDKDDVSGSVAAEGDDSSDGGKSDGGTGTVGSDSRAEAAHGDADLDSEAEREAQIAAAVEALDIRTLPPAAFMTPMPTLPAVSPLSQHTATAGISPGSTSNKSYGSDSDSSKSSGTSGSEDGSGTSGSGDGAKSSEGTESSKTSSSGASAGSQSMSGPSAGGHQVEALLETAETGRAAELSAAGGPTLTSQCEGLTAAAAASIGVTGDGVEASGGVTAAAVGDETGTVEDSDITLPPSDDGEPQQLDQLAAVDGCVDNDSGFKSSGLVEGGFCEDVLPLTQAVWADAAAIATQLGLDGSAGTACTGDGRAVKCFKRKAPSDDATPDGTQVVLPDPEDTLDSRPATKKRRKNPAGRPAARMEDQQTAAHMQLQGDQPQGGQLEPAKRPLSTAVVTLPTLRKSTEEEEAVGAIDADAHALPGVASRGRRSADVPSILVTNKRAKVVTMGPDRSTLQQSGKPVDQYEIPSSDTLGDGDAQEDVNQGDVKNSDVGLRAAGERGRSAGRGRGRGAGRGGAHAANVENAAAPGSELPIEGRGRVRSQGRGRGSGRKVAGSMGVAEPGGANILDLQLSSGGWENSLPAGRTRRSSRVATGTAGAADSGNVNATDAVTKTPTERRGRGRARGSGG